MAGGGGPTGGPVTFEETSSLTLTDAAATAGISNFLVTDDNGNIVILTGTGDAGQPVFTIASNPN